MALRNLIASKVDTANFTPPPLRLAVVKVADTPRVVSWKFDGATASPSVIKKNKTAVVSDGRSLAKVTLYEAHTGRLTEGMSYVMKGHSLRGQHPPYFINIGKQTTFFRGPVVPVSEELKADAIRLLHPSSTLVHLRESHKSAHSLMTVEADIQEISAINRCKVGFDEVPMRRVSIKQDNVEAVIYLWREAAITQVEVGDAMRFTHLKAKCAESGVLQSTNFTQMEKCQINYNGVTVIGISSDEGSTLQMLLEDGQVLAIKQATWNPFDQALMETTLKVDLQVQGNLIEKITIVDNEI